MRVLHDHTGFSGKPPAPGDNPIVNRIYAFAPDALFAAMTVADCR